MRYTSFTGSCIGKITTILVCILIGVVLTVGGVALAGYIVLTREGMMGTIEEKAQENNLPIDFSDEYAEMSILNWGTDALEKLSSINEMTLGELQDTVGYTGITAIMHESLGIEESILKKATFGTLGETITDNLTLKLAADKFGMEYPSLPIFEDETFLAEPISTALKSLDERTLGDLVEVTDDSSKVLKNLEDLKIGEISDPDNGIDSRINGMKLGDVIEITTEGEGKSHGVLIALKDITIGGLGGTEGKDTINKLRLSDLLTIKDPAEEGGSSKFMWALRNASIATYDAKYSALNEPNADPILDAEGNSVLDEMGEPTYYRAGDAAHDETGAEKTAVAGDYVYNSAGEKVQILGIEDRLKTIPFNKLVNTGNSYIWNYLGTATTETIGAKVDNMCIKDAVQITESSNAILRKMRKPTGDEDPSKFGDEDLKISELGGNKLTDLVKDTNIEDIIEINDEDAEPPKVPSAKILRSLKGTKIGGLDARIKSFKVADVLTETQCSSGVMQLVDCENTLLTDLATVMTAQIKASTVERLKKAGIITNNFDGLNIAMATRIRNQTLTQMVDTYKTLLTNPMGVSNNVFTLPTAVLPATASYTQADFDAMNAGSPIPNGTVIILSEDTTLKGAFTKAYSFLLNGHDLTLDDGTTVAEDKFTMRSRPDAVDYGGYSRFSNAEEASLGAVAGGALYYGTDPYSEQSLDPDDLTNATQKLTFEFTVTVLIPTP